MAVNLIPEDELRDALRPFRPDAEAFEAGVRERLEKLQSEQQDDPLAGFPPLLRSAAALLPLPLVAAGKVSATGAKLIPASGIYKLLGYVAFPAVSLFVLFAAALYGFARVRRAGEQNGSGPTDPQLVADAARQWWRDHKRGFWLVFAATMIMQWFGATWILFLIYIVSFGLLVFVLSALGKVGLGNRATVGSSCMMGLMFFGQLAGFSGTGERDIHFIDPMVTCALFMGGGLFLGIYMAWQGTLRRMKGVPRWLFCVSLPAIVIPAIVWFTSPLLWPATPQRINRYVESFDQAPFSSSSWQRWAIVASWAIERNLDPDMSAPRRLVKGELAGERNPYVLACALQTGLLSRDELDQPELAKRYEQELKSLLERHAAALARGVRDGARPAQPALVDPRIILSIEPKDWVFRAAALRGDLTDEDRDYLASRLHATMDDILGDRRDIQDITDPMYVTRMLAVIERPVDPDRYRDRIGPWLLRFHCQSGGGFQPAGGFEKYFRQRGEQAAGPAAEPARSWLMKIVASSISLRAGSLESTASAVELMQTYGIPPELDINWVRAYLTPTMRMQTTGEKWIAAVTLDRLNRLPGATPPTWLEWLYYERSLLAAIVLVGLCIYATAASPKPSAEATAALLTLERASAGKFPWARLAIVMLIAIGLMLGVATYVIVSMPVLPEFGPVPIQPKFAVPPPHLRPLPPRRPRHQRRHHRSAEEPPTPTPPTE